jgi:uncharacterized protein YaaW (UPF0174 family)
MTWTKPSDHLGWDLEAYDCRQVSTDEKAEVVSKGGKKSKYYELHIDRKAKIICRVRKKNKKNTVQEELQPRKITRQELESMIRDRIKSLLKMLKRRRLSLGQGLLVPPRRQDGSRDAPKILRFEE